MNDISDTELVLVRVLSLLIGSTIIAEPHRQNGLDEALTHLRETFRTEGRPRGAALVENIRLQATDQASDPGFINALRKGVAGQA